MPSPRTVAPDSEDLHRRLNHFARRRMLPTIDDGASWEDDLREECEMRRLERAWVEAERAAIAAQAARAPSEAGAFVAWFEALRDVGPGQHDPLFPWLAEHASFEQMTWFLRQEMAGEAGFDDLVALTQVRLPVQAKLELARNHWDEMGQGQARAMHGPMLERLAHALDLTVSADQTVWESLALANLMVALASNRHYAFQAIGALGVIELTAPDRAARVNAGLKRLGVRADARRYYALHATLDRKHAAAWNREVLHSLVASDPCASRPIAQGALLRQRAGARCFERYRRQLFGSSGR
jgi:hypothetical protein